MGVGCTLFGYRSHAANFRIWSMLQTRSWRCRRACQLLELPARHGLASRVLSCESFWQLDSQMIASRITSHWNKGRIDLSALSKVCELVAQLRFDRLSACTLLWHVEHLLASGVRQPCRHRAAVSSGGWGGTQRGSRLHRVRIAFSSSQLSNLVDAPDKEVPSGGDTLSSLPASRAASKAHRLHII